MRTQTIAGDAVPTADQSAGHDRGSAADHDVAVIGAGLAGLTAARRLSEHGLDTVVLEAADRVGGRTLNMRIGEHVVEGGGAWGGPGQTALIAMLDELGLERVPTYTEGRHVVLHRGRRRTFSGDVPRLGALAVLDLAQAQIRLDRLARSLPPGRPWDAPDAARLDALTLGAWAARNTRTSGARMVLSTFATGLLGALPGTISLLAFLAHVRAAGSLAHLVDVEGGGQEWRIRGGSGLISERLAEQLGERVRLRSPVRTVRHAEDRVELETDSERVTARRLIVAMDPALTGRLRFEPELPVRHRTLGQRWRMGTGVKLHLAYPSPFWRDAGLSGQAIADEGYVRLTFDSSPEDGSAGILVGFAGVDWSRPGEGTDMLDRSPSARRDAALAAVARLFGPRARRCSDYVEQDWSHEPHIAGCVPATPPGLLSAAGSALGEWVGPIGFAGAERSARWEGHMDGAIHSGTQAARECVESLATAASVRG